MGCGCPEIKPVKKMDAIKPNLIKNFGRCNWCSGVLKRFPNGDVRCSSCGNKK